LPLSISIKIGAELVLNAKTLSADIEVPEFFLNVYIPGINNARIVNTKLRTSGAKDDIPVTRSEPRIRK
jgi:hypothetical protein